MKPPPSLLRSTDGRRRNRIGGMKKPAYSSRPGGPSNASRPPPPVFPDLADNGASVSRRSFILATADKIKEQITDAIASPARFAEIVLSHWMNLKRPAFHDELYRICKDERRGLVMAPRFFGKSVIFSRVYPLWKAITSPGVDVMIVSATEAIAVEQMRYIKAEFESNVKLRAYFGDFTTDKWTQDEIRLKNGSRIMAKGQGFQIRGLHPTHVICDDLESEHVVSQDQREKLRYWFDTTLMGALGKDAQLLVVGTVLHPQSLLTDLMKKKDWARAKFTALDVSGRSIWEEKAATDWLLKMKADNEYAFQQEFMNNPLRSGETVFRGEWLTLRVPFPPPKTELVYTAIDPAISKKDGACETAIVTFGVIDSRVFELESKHGRWSTDETLEEVKRTYHTWMPMMIGVEEQAYQKALSEIIVRHCPWLTIHPFKADKDKRRRAMGVTGMFQRGCVYLSSPALIEQLTLFTGSDHDGLVDLVDAAVYCLHLIQLYCYPEIEASLRPQEENPRPPQGALSSMDKRVWDQIHAAQDRSEELRGVRADPYLGSEW